jgi:hypothetical protein
MKSEIPHITPRLTRLFASAVAAAATAATVASAAAQNGTPAGAPPTGDEIELARQALDAYYQNQRLTSKEEADWKLAKAILQSRIELVTAQIADLKQRTEEQQDKTTEADVERLELSEKLAGLDRVYDLQQHRVGDLEAAVRRVIALAPDVPELRSKIDPSIDRLPAEGAQPDEIKAPVAERFLNVLAILKFTNEFHRNAALTNETRQLSEGREVEVRTLYLGLGQAYFHGGREDDPVAGVGYPSPGGWKWEEKPDAAAEIKKLIDIFEGAEVAAFVPVPVVVP